MLGLKQEKTIANFGESRRRRPRDVERIAISGPKPDKQIVVVMKSGESGSAAPAGPASRPPIEGTVPVEAPPAAPVAAGESAAAADRAGLQKQMKDYSDAVQKFCSNIGPTAIEARTAAQKKMIAELEEKIQKRIAQLQSKIEETKEWLNRREAFAAKATSGLVEVLKKMEPEAAAAQLAQMDVETAAALLLKLDPKAAAPLLDEMPAAKAAQLASLVAASTGSLRRSDTLEKGEDGKVSSHSAGSPVNEASETTGSVEPLDASAGRGADVSNTPRPAPKSQPADLPPENVR